MLTRYADDWVAVWNGSRDRAEEIKAEIKTFLADEIQLRLSGEKTLITRIDDGFDFLGYRMQGDKRWQDGRWCLFSRVADKAIRRFRDAVGDMLHHTLHSPTRQPPSPPSRGLSAVGATTMLTPPTVS